MNWTDLLSRYLPPRLIQTLVVLLVLALLFGADRLARWVEALGTATALRLLGLEAG